MGDLNQLEEAMKIDQSQGNPSPGGGGGVAAVSRADCPKTRGTF